MLSKARANWKDRRLYFSGRSPAKIDDDLSLGALEVFFWESRSMLSVKSWWPNWPMLKLA